MCGYSYAEDEARKENGLASNGVQADGVHTLLQVIADIYTVYPNLWLDPDLRCTPSTIAYSLLQENHKLLPRRF